MLLRFDWLSRDFQSLLEKIVEHLQLSKPLYEVIDKSRNNAYVSVRARSGRPRFVFFGGPAVTVEESREREAQKAVQKLRARFNIRVSDFTSERVKMLSFCGKLIKHKCVALLHRKHGAAAPTRQGNLRNKSLTARPHVSVDYVAFLDIVGRKTGAFIILVKAVWVEGHESSVAVQQAAKKGVFYLVSKYRLEIIDVNYGDAAPLSLECARLGGGYLALKSRLAKQEAESSLAVQPSSFRSEKYLRSPRRTPCDRQMRRRRGVSPAHVASSGARPTRPLVAGLQNWRLLLSVRRHA
uniref:Uncharacterized protein n=1 Tax=Chenopodium quinoa TaxID=63459 RepID=A0A803MU34_CHEQI